MSYPEPPAVGTEIDTLLGSLERQRATFAYKCADLDAEQLALSVGASSVTLGGLLGHLAYLEDLNFTVDLAGRPLPEPWASIAPEARSDEVWRSAAGDRPDELYALWRAAVDRSRDAVREAVARDGLDTVFVVASGASCSLRRLLVDFVEEYARHTGHADLIRESIDGRVGEDPPGPPYAYQLAEPH